MIGRLNHVAIAVPDLEAAAAQYRDALEHLLIVLRADKDFNDGEARKVFLDSLATIGKGDPLAAEYQRKLFSLMY